MEVEGPSQSDAGLSDEQLQTLARRVVELLASEPYAHELAASVAAELALPGPALPEPQLPRRDSDGPVPIGPYEIRPDFADVRWDGSLPAAPLWPGHAQRGVGPGSNAAGQGDAGPGRGPHVCRRSPGRP